MTTPPVKLSIVVAVQHAERNLPEIMRARLLRHMASGALTDGHGWDRVAEWLSRSQKLNPGDRRTRLLSTAHRISPGLCRGLLRIRNKMRRGPRLANPFADVDRSSR